MSETNDLKKFRTRAGEQLYWMLPAVYRNRDNAGVGRLGDLANYLDACGELLDLIKNTLDQRLADALPNSVDKDRSCQSWLLPYHCDLLDVQLVSPTVGGKREELKSAISWRQRKGTNACIEEIAQGVAELDIEIQEGWKRVATTPRIGFPLRPSKTLGGSENFDDVDFRLHPGYASRHPGLPALTVDFRYPSRAVQTGEDSQQASNLQNAKLTLFGDTEAWWYHGNPHGNPCFPNSYEDVSRRTVDVRETDWRKGHLHPKRILLFTPPRLGFFGPSEIAGKSIRKTAKSFTEDILHQREDFVFHSTVTVEAGRIKLERCAVKKLVVKTASPENSTDDSPIPVLEAKDCIFGDIEVGDGGMSRLEYCTIMGEFTSGSVQASDCIFAGPVTAKKYSELNCIRYSRIHPKSTVPMPLGLDMFKITSNTVEMPIFAKKIEEIKGSIVIRPLEFGKPGYGVLHPAAPESIRSGAEDGGEMGAYHHLKYCQYDVAVLKKLENYLPVGMVPALIPDWRLLTPPVIVKKNQ